MTQELIFDREGWHTDKAHIKCCKTPFKVNSKDQRIYKMLISHHCEHPDKESQPHVCCGAITITEKSILMRCKKCGDAKGTFET